MPCLSDIVVCLSLTIISIEFVEKLWNLIWPTDVPVDVLVTVRRRMVDRSNGICAASRRMVKLASPEIVLYTSSLPTLTGGTGLDSVKAWL